MKFVPVNEEIVPVTKIRSETQKLLLEFMESDLNSAEVVGYPHKNAESCASSLRATAERLRIYGILVTRRKDRVFLIRKEV